MLHLDENLSIRKDAWDEYMSLPTANRFTVAMLRFMYTPKELSHRSVSGSSTWKTPNGVHTRKQLTPKKSKVIESKFLLHNSIL